MFSRPGGTLKAVPRVCQHVTRLRALGYGALVAVIAFYYLAVPTLRDLVGPAVLLPAYAAVAALVGVVTYHVVRYLSRVDADDGAASDEANAMTSPVHRESATLIEDGETDDGDDLAVDEMLVELETDREE